jgi:hypothetical protein
VEHKSGSLIDRPPEFTKTEQNVKSGTARRYRSP